MGPIVDGHTFVTFNFYVDCIAMLTKVFRYKNFDKCD